MAQDDQVHLFLEEIGEDYASGSFRVYNLPVGDPNRVERKYIIANQGELYEGANLAAALHGTLTENGSLASLVVVDFEDQRFQQATITISFRDRNGTVGEGPWITKFAPSGRTCMNPTLKHVELKTAFNVSLQGGGGPVSANAGTAYEKTTSQDMQDGVTVTGRSLFEGPAQGEKRKIQWTLSENKSRKSGLPSHVRCLVLLERPDEDEFQAEVEIVTTLDWKSALKRFRAKTEVDDPVIFDPQLAVKREYAWQRKNKLDLNNLEAVDLDEHIIMLDAKIVSDKS